jgi:hypothetical protein
MSYWKWVEDLAEAGVPVSVAHGPEGWSITIGGHLWSERWETAREAIAEAIATQAKVGAKAVAELEATRRRLALLNKAMTEAA